MILMREKCTSSRSRDCHGLFFMNKQRMCVWAHESALVTYLRVQSTCMFPILKEEHLHKSFLLLLNAIPASLGTDIATRCPHRVVAGHFSAVQN